MMCEIWAGISYKCEENVSVMLINLKLLYLLLKKWHFRRNLNLLLEIQAQRKLWNIKCYLCEYFCKLQHFIHKILSVQQHYSQESIEGMINACNSQSKPGYAWKANGVLVSNAGLEINFTKHYTSAKYYVASHLLIYTLDELTLNWYYSKLFLFSIVFVYQLTLATF